MTTNPHSKLGSEHSENLLLTLSRSNVNVKTLGLTDRYQSVTLNIWDEALHHPGTCTFLMLPCPARV